MDVKGRRVLYISYDGMTDPLGQSQVIPYLRSLTENGYQFTILSVEKEGRFHRSSELISGLLKQAGIEWVTLPFTSRPPIISKIIDQRKLNRKAEQLFRKEKFDIVHCRSYVAAEAGLRLAKRFKVPFLFDMRGFWVDERVDSGLWNLKNPFYRALYRFYKKKERNYFSSADHIISLTHKGKQEIIRSFGIKEGKISVIPCCADLDHFNYEKFSTEDVEKTRRQLGIPSNVKVLSYLGSLGGWYMNEQMFDLFSAMRKQLPDARFLLITHDPVNTIQAMAAAKGIPAEAVIVAPASREEVPAFLSVSDFNIFFIKDVYSKKASSPTKQGEVMAMGIPIICNDIGDTGMIIEDTQAGVTVNAFSKAAYENALQQLLHSDFSKEKIRNGAFKYYDLREGVKVYQQVYQTLVN